MKYIIGVLVMVVLSGCTNNMTSSQLLGVNVISVKDCCEPPITRTH